MPIRTYRVCGCGHEEIHHELVNGKPRGPCTRCRDGLAGTCPGFHSRRRGARNSGSTIVLPDPHRAALNALRDAELALRDATHAVARAFAALSTNGHIKPRLVLPTDDLEPVVHARDVEVLDEYTVRRRRAPAPVVTTVATGARRVLTAIASTRAGATREQLTILTGYKKTSRDTYLRKVFAAGHAERQGERIVVTASGAAWLGPLEKLPTGQALRDQWLERLRGGERVLLAALLAAYPDPLDIDQLSAVTHYTKTSGDTYLRKLQARELIVKPRPGVVIASKTLFEAP